jgi:hypothetical protein
VIRAPLLFTANDCLDIGKALGSPVSLNYRKKAPFKFNGKIDQVRVHYVTGRGTLMKAGHLLLITALIVGGKDDAQHMCSGKTGQELQQCLKSNQEKLSSNCKDAVSKLPNPPK